MHDGENASALNVEAQENTRLKQWLDMGTSRTNAIFAMGQASKGFGEYMENNLVYFAAHAPNVPEWFKRKEWREKVLEPMHKSPDGREGWVHEVMKDCAEDQLAHFVRWRMTYAAAMMSALPNVV